MGKLLFVLVLLLSVTTLAIADETSIPLIRAIDLNAAMLLKRPELATADTLALLVETNRGAYYKLSEQDKILATGKLLPGSNSLLFSRPGLFAGNQSLFLLFDLLENGVNFQKKINITMTIIEEMAITVIEETAIELQKKEKLSGTFALGMYHAGHQIGFRKKSMVDHLNLKIGPVTTVEDLEPIRHPPASQGVSFSGLLAIPQFLAYKKSQAIEKANALMLQKKRLTLNFYRQDKNGTKHNVKARIALQVDGA